MRGDLARRQDSWDCYGNSGSGEDFRLARASEVLVWGILAGETPRGGGSPTSNIFNKQDSIVVIVSAIL